ncbi:MAG TPA: HemK/PrmC family methyltransferase [Jiangellaceae bacterium]|nr:HemK/PrmC family methyltransferase [Jiangellaceae bacterium]
MLRLRELVAAAAERLAAAGVPSPRHDAEVLAAHLLGVGRAELLLEPEPDESFAVRYAELVGRRAGREPLQHITGVVHFRYLTLQVGPGVFVPRPETELTAGVAIDAAREVLRSGRTPVVADLYAGSGPIALSLAEEVPGAQVHAVETDDGAVGWLRRNIAAWQRDDRPGTGHQVPGQVLPAVPSSVSVHHVDVSGCLAGFDARLDVVAANPPYVPTGARIRDPEVAAHDPAAALWAGADGLAAFRVLERTAARLLRPGGLVVAEHADVQGESAPAVFAATGRWADVTDHADLTGRPRYLTARRGGPRDPAR